MVQNMISKSVHSFASKENLNRLSVYETKIFKRFHRGVINDQGIPNLKKRAFEIPGTRPVWNDTERGEYTDRLANQQKTIKEEDDASSQASSQELENEISNALHSKT